MLPDEDIYSNFDLTYAKIMKHRDLELFQSKIGSHEISSQIIPNLQLKVCKQQQQLWSNSFSLQVWKMSHMGLYVCQHITRYLPI